METIEKFAIHLDISDRDRLYDYVTCRHIRRPDSGKWNLDDLQKYGDISNITDNEEENEKEITRIYLMDKAIVHERLLEQCKDDGECKDLPKGTEHEAIIGPPPPREDYGVSVYPAGPRRRVLPIYRRGDVVKGDVVFTLTEPLEASKVSVDLTGQVVVNMRIYHRWGYTDDTRREKFTENSQDLWLSTANGGNYHKPKELSQEFLTLGPTSTPGPAYGRILERGLHTFYFEFQIPTGVPQSVPPMIARSPNFAHLVYRLKASIDQGGTFRAGTVVANQGLLVETDKDISDNMEDLKPVVQEEARDVGVVTKTGEIKIRASLPRRAYLKGTAIPLTLEVQNMTKDEALPVVKAKIRLFGKVKMSSSKISVWNSVNIRGRKMTAGPVGPGQCPGYKWQLPWDFSKRCVDGELLPVGDIEQSKLVNVRYEVAIKVKRSGVRRNIVMGIPLTIGNKNASWAAGVL